MLLLSRKSDDTSPCPVWEVLLKPARRMQVGDKIFFHNRVHATITRRISEKKWLITLVPQMDFEAFLSGYGNVTLPPYIKRKNDDASHHNDTERYQTVYAKIPGSVAAPTAGLHFSELILDVLEKKGVHVVSVTLHVGYGTFLPVESSHVEEHVMEEEHFVIDKDASDIINSAGNVIAVGTTSTRVIESVADEKGTVRAHSSSTDLFIYPGYRFRRVNTLLTNFHLPRSSLFLLVCAFAGPDLIHEAYRRAIENGYRFYSYGDCMLIM